MSKIKLICDDCKKSFPHLVKYSYLTIEKGKIISKLPVQRCAICAYRMARVSTALWEAQHPDLCKKLEPYIQEEIKSQDYNEIMQRVEDQLKKEEKGD